MDTHGYAAVLWDIPADKQSTLPRDFVRGRVLAYGTLGLVIQLIREDGQAIVRAALSALRPTALSARKRHYMERYLLA